MAILKLVKGKIIITEVVHCPDDTCEVTIKLTGLDWEQCVTLKWAYKMGMEVQVIPVEEPFSMGYKVIKGGANVHVTRETG